MTSCLLCGGELQAWEVAEPNADGWCDRCASKGDIVYQCPTSKKRIQAVWFHGALDLSFFAPGCYECNWVALNDTVFSMLDALAQAQSLQLGDSLSWRHGVLTFGAMKTPLGIEISFRSVQWNCTFTPEQLQSFVKAIRDMTGCERP